MNLEMGKKKAWRRTKYIIEEEPPNNCQLDVHETKIVFDILHWAHCDFLRFIYIFNNILPLSLLYFFIWITSNCNISFYLFFTTCLVNEK